MNITLEQAEAKVLSQVKFINSVLEECRKRNKELADEFGMSYGKFIGVGTVYEEVIHSLRKVKGELDGYLKTLRENISREYDRKIPRRPGPRPVSDEDLPPV